jgi:hypothetical protein
MRAAPVSCARFMFSRRARIFSRSEGPCFSSSSISSRSFLKLYWKTRLRIRATSLASLAACASRTDILGSASAVRNARSVILVFSSSLSSVSSSCILSTSCLWVTRRPWAAFANLSSSAIIIIIKP